MRRFTRLTNGFSKKIENQGHALALYFVHYNFARVHQTLRLRRDGGRFGRSRLDARGNRRVTGLKLDHYRAAAFVAKQARTRDIMTNPSSC